MKYILSIAYLVLFSLNATAERSGYVNLNELLKSDSDLYNDVGYLHVIPQYEENPDPAKAVAIEFFFGEYDGSQESIDKLKQIQDILSDDKRLDPNFKTEVIAVSNRTDTLKHSPDFQKFLGAMKLSDNKVHMDQIPDFLDYSAKIKSKNKDPKRYPAAAMDGRKFWTLVRFSSSMAGTFAGLYYLEGMSATMAASISFWPGLASGGLTYYSNSFGSFLTNGKWATWLLEADNFFTKRVRKAFKIDKASFSESLVKNKDFFRKKYPTLYQKNPTLFDPIAVEEAVKASKKQSSKLTKILARLKHAEEYFKWWVTEVGFVAIAIKAPQAIAGTSASTSILSATGDVLMGSAMGMLAQGPGDIAIQVRKYQKVEELKASVLAGKVDVENKKMLLDEIEKVLAKSGKHAAYTIHDGSHAALVKIENWARSRATIISFFSVTGVALEIAGVPLAKPMLIGLGSWGIIYYSSVQGWFNPGKLKDSALAFVRALRNGEIKFNMQFLKTRYCAAKFVPAH